MEDKEPIKNFILYLSVFVSAVWLGVYGYFFKHLNTKFLLFDIFAFSLPIASIWIHYFYLQNKVNAVEDRGELLVYIDERIRAEQAFIDILPVTIFGTGILLTNFITNLDKVIRDFYLVIVFGLLIPLLTTSLTFTVSNIYKKLTNDIISFSSESYAFAIFFIIFHKLYVQSYSMYKSYLMTYIDRDNKKYVSGRAP